MPVIGLLSTTPPGEVPATHLDLVECPPVAALTTLAPDGSPQTSVVWCDFDGETVRVNTMRGFAKEQSSVTLGSRRMFRSLARPCG